MSEGSVFDLYLLDPGPRPIPIYNVIVRLTGLNIKQARRVADAAPVAIVTQVPPGQADALKIELAPTGARLELRPGGPPGAETDLI
jgi:large subunit ribosomal protein L7/L12